MKTLEINFAPLSGDIESQLSLQDFTCDDKLLERFEKLRNSVNMLYFNDYISENSKDKCFKKLFKEIQSKIVVNRIHIDRVLEEVNDDTKIQSVG